MLTVATRCATSAPCRHKHPSWSRETTACLYKCCLSGLSEHTCSVRGARTEHACSDNPRERSTRAPKIRANGARVLRKSPRTEHSESRSKWSARQLSPRPPPSHPSPSPPPSHLSAPHPHPTQGPVPHHTTCSRFVAQLVDVHTNMTSDAQAHHRVAIQI